VRPPSAVLLVVLCAAASGQPRGGVTGGGGAPGGSHHGAPAPLMNPFVHPSFPQQLGATVSGFSAGLTFPQQLGAAVSGSNAGLPAFWAAPGQGRFPGWNNMPRFGSPGFSRPSGPGWNGASTYSGSEFSSVPYPVFVGGPYGPDYSPQQPSAAVPPPQYIAEPAPPVRIIEPGSGIRTFQAPVATREPATQHDHPTLIALKNGWSYTVTTYWMKGKTLHFITTHGAHIQVPLTSLDRLYGHQRRDQSADSKLPPIR
jgi:hypothetical protein